VLFAQRHDGARDADVLPQRPAREEMHPREARLFTALFTREQRQERENASVLVISRASHVFRRVAASRMIYCREQQRPPHAVVKMRFTLSRFAAAKTIVGAAAARVSAAR